MEENRGENTNYNNNNHTNHEKLFLPLGYPVIYEIPESYKPPENLADDLEYPNLNVEDYKSRPIDRTCRMHKMWEALAANETTGSIIIGTNKSGGKECSASFWGFDGIQNLSEENAKYRVQCPWLITNIRFVKDNLFLLTMVNGECQLWESCGDTRNPKELNLFKNCSQSEHTSPILCLDISSNGSKAVTGGEDCKLKIWDVETNELFVSHTYRYSHLDSINSISFSSKSDDVFVTCSDDKSILVWDLRRPKPASAALENHDTSLKSVTWAKDTAEENFIYCGDEAGDLCTIDLRAPNKILEKKTLFNHAIRKLIPNKSGYLGVIADTNIVKILEPKTLKVVYTNEDALNFVRDGAWYQQKTFLTVGFDGKLRVHNM